MRRGRITLFIMLLAVSFSSCKTIADKNEIEDIRRGTAIISFDQLEYNFGAITEGEKVACMFKFTNTGDGDLVINSATTSCGCTIPRFEEEPIAPGGEGTMEVVFDSSHRNGAQTKTITVRSNASVKVVVLRILAEVINE